MIKHKYDSKNIKIYFSPIVKEVPTLWDCLIKSGSLAGMRTPDHSSKDLSQQRRGVPSGLPRAQEHRRRPEPDHGDLRLSQKRVPERRPQYVRDLRPKWISDKCHQCKNIAPGEVTEVDSHDGKFYCFKCWDKPRCAECKKTVPVELDPGDGQFYCSKCYFEDNSTSDKSSRSASRQSRALRSSTPDSCAECRKTAPGKVDPDDSQFYCLKCWKEYAPYEPD